ncbi:MAG: lactate utilization protein [Magnetovibrio sp.]|nr:lactate utilization protein [Magnetovibrio sp.]|tara:strand:- start:424 stop:1104 length:681 start_codon:yes stop_codon:yes gene_type:complete
MSTDREAILRRLKTKLYRDENPITDAFSRLQAPPLNIIPKRGANDLKNKVKNFIEEAEMADATVTKIEGLASLPKVITHYLASQNLPTGIRVADSLVDVNWGSQPLLSVKKGRAKGTDLVGVSRAFAGVAETGTLIYLSGEENPSTLHLLPPTHIAVLMEKDILGNYENAWTNVRLKCEKNAEGATSLPRAVSWVTGPSRSGDIEQTLLLGVHGPQRLHIVVVGNG